MSVTLNGVTFGKKKEVRPAIVIFYEKTKGNPEIINEQDQCSIAKAVIKEVNADLSCSSPKVQFTYEDKDWHWIKFSNLSPHLVEQANHFREDNATSDCA